MDKELLYRFFEGRASVEEMRLVKEWSEASEENSKLLRRERKLFNAIILSGRFESSDGQTTLRKKRNHFVREFLKIASVVAITVGITAALFSIGEDKEDMNVAMQTITVPAGQRVNLDLPDGSNVWLNAGTTMKYPVSFMKGKREVMLDGEAYFEVTRDEKYPFVVSVKNFDVRVLGTSFNVMSYDDEFASSVTLLSGKVETTSGHDTVRLSPGEQVSITSDNRMTVQKTDINVVVSWMDGKFGFSNERLDVIMRKICRWYDVEVLYAVPGIRERRFTGAPASNMPLKELLEALSTTTNLQFSLQDGVITIKQN